MCDSGRLLFRLYSCVENGFKISVELLTVGVWGEDDMTDEFDEMISLEPYWLINLSKF